MTVSRRTTAHDEASPYLKITLAIGEPPHARVHGWVVAMITHGEDNVPPEQLWARYGASLRAECAAAGFEPAYLVPLAQQAPEARAAAKAWAARVTAAGAY